MYKKNTLTLLKIVILIQGYPKFPRLDSNLAVVLLLQVGIAGICHHTLQEILIFIRMEAKKALQELKSVPSWASLACKSET